MDEIEALAQTVLEHLLNLPFPECTAISRTFADLTTKPGIYAVRHRHDGLLYVGKAQDIKERFKGGHKSLTWSWLADYDHRDVAISAYTLDFMQWRALSSDLEGFKLAKLSFAAIQTLQLLLLKDFRNKTVGFQRKLHI